MNTTKLVCGMLIGLGLAACSASSETDGPEGQSVANATEGKPGGLAVGDAADLEASDDTRFWMLSGTWQRTAIASSGGLDLAVFTVGGADADINSMTPYLTVGRGDKKATYELGLMIQTVEKAVLSAPDVVSLEGTTMTVNDKGEIVPGDKWKATVKIGADSVTLTRNGETTTIKPATDEGPRFLPSVRAVHTASGQTENDAYVRVFETSTAGKTGNGLLLSVMTYPEEKTFDLGINVKSVTKVAAKKDGEVQIEATDAATSKPVAYSITYKLDAEGVAGGIIRLKRVR